MQEVWAQVDDYFGELLAPLDEILTAALAANKKAGLPPIDVTALQGKFLEFLVRISGTRRILEIGTLGGYSTIWLARGLPSDGCIVSLELVPLHAEVARANLRHAGVLPQVDLRVGPALESLQALCPVRSDLHRRGQADLSRIPSVGFEAIAPGNRYRRRQRRPRRKGRGC